MRTSAAERAASSPIGFNASRDQHRLLWRRCASLEASWLAPRPSNVACRSAALPRLGSLSARLRRDRCALSRKLARCRRLRPVVSVQQARFPYSWAHVRVSPTIRCVRMLRPPASAIVGGVGRSHNPEGVKRRTGTCPDVRSQRLTSRKHLFFGDLRLSGTLRIPPPLQWSRCWFARPRADTARNCPCFCVTARAGCGSSTSLRLCFSTSPTGGVDPLSNPSGT